MDNQKETNEVKHIPGQNTSSQPQGGNLQNYEDKEKKQERIDALYRSWLEGKRSFLTQVVITLFLGALLATLNLLNSNSIETLNLSQNKLAAYLLSLALFPLIPLLFIVFLNAFLLESSHLQWKF